MRSSLVLALTLAALGLASSPASADTTADARVVFAAGSKAYRLGDYRAAIQAFEQANRVEARPGLLFSIAQAHRRQYYVDRRPGHLTTALKRYNEYLAQVPQGGRRADATAAIAELTPIVEKLEQEGQLVAVAAPEETATRVMISSPASGATILVDDETKASPAPFIAEVKAGKHKIIVRAEGYFEERREIDVTPGAVTALDIPLKDKPALLTVDAPAGAAVSVDARLVGTTPLAGPLEIAHGQHRVLVTLAGHASYQQVVDLERARKTSLVAAMPMTFQRKTSLGLMLGGGAVALGGLVLGGVALGLQAEAQSILGRMKNGEVVCRETSCPDLDTYNAAVAARDGFRIGSGVLLGAGVVAAGGAAFLYFFDTLGLGAKKSDDTKPALQLSAAPVLAPGYAGAALSGQF